MTPSQARAFQAVATEGSFTAGARKLGVSQPTVTNQVRQIEGRYGVELFHRTAHGVRMTATGEDLLAIVRRVFGSFDEALAYLQEAQGMRLGRLRVGSYGPYDVIPMIARYRAHYPAIAVTIEFANSRELAQRLLHYDLDVAVLGRETYHPEFQVLPFSTPALVALAPRSAEWDGRKSISAEEFSKHTLICREPGSAARNAFERLLGGTHEPGATLIEIGSREGIVAAVAEGLGLAVLFDEGTLPETRVIKLKIGGSTIVSQIDVVCLKERRATPTLKSFLAIAREMARKRA
jgi:LysR family transcriptional regulator, low CO2-responsive transcriptional regulator